MVLLGLPCETTNGVWCEIECTTHYGVKSNTNYSSILTPRKDSPDNENNLVLAFNDQDCKHFGPGNFPIHPLCLISPLFARIHAIGRYHTHLPEDVSFCDRIIRLRTAVDFWHHPFQIEPNKVLPVWIEACSPDSIIQSVRCACQAQRNSAEMSIEYGFNQILFVKLRHDIFCMQF